MDGKLYGKEVKKFVNGDVLECKWKSGSAKGKGVQTLSNGDIIEGEWNDDELDVYKKASGSV